MTTNFTSGLLAGVTAAVVWLAVADMMGLTGSVGLVALILLVVTTLVSTLIAAAVTRSRA